MLKKTTWILVIVALAGTAAWRLPRTPAPADRVAEARPAFPGFNLETFDGGTLTHQDLEGVVTLVTFWASWCPACRAELPLLDSLDTAVQRPDFAVIGINEDTNEAAARSLVEKMGLQMTQLLGRGLQRARYNYWGIPYTVLLDRDGRIVQTWYGYPGRHGFDTEMAGRAMELLDEPVKTASRHAAPVAGGI